MVIQFDNPEGEQMYVSLITGGVVYATVPIANNGTYNFLWHRKQSHL
jgi:hypothetical protein